MLWFFFKKEMWIVILLLWFAILSLFLYKKYEIINDLRNSYELHYFALSGQITELNRTIYQLQDDVYQLKISCKKFGLLDTVQNHEHSLLKVKKNDSL